MVLVKLRMKVQAAMHWPCPSDVPLHHMLLCEWQWSLAMVAFKATRLATRGTRELAIPSLQVFLPLELAAGENLMERGKLEHIAGFSCSCW